MNLLLRHSVCNGKTKGRIPKKWSQKVISLIITIDARMQRHTNIFISSHFAAQTGGT